jgi:hypothetical protein
MTVTMVGKILYNAQRHRMEESISFFRFLGINLGVDKVDF